VGKVARPRPSSFIGALRDEGCLTEGRVYELAKIIESPIKKGNGRRAWAYNQIEGRRHYGPLLAMDYRHADPREKSSQGGVCQNLKILFQPILCYHGIG
jgi:hypothetical protein